MMGEPAPRVPTRLGGCREPESRPGFRRQRAFRVREKPQVRVEPHDPAEGAEPVVNKRNKPDSSGGLLDGTRMDESPEFGEEPVQVALVTRAAGDELGRSAATRPRPLSDIGRFPGHPSTEIDLPPLPKGDVPEHEQAVRIDDVTVDPGSVPLGDTGTSSVEIQS